MAKIKIISTLLEDNGKKNIKNIYLGDFATSLENYEKSEKFSSNKFFKENTLLNQEFIKESKTSVSQYLNKIEKDLTVTDFKRVGLGV